MIQAKILQVTPKERRKEIKCEVCRGDWRLCKWSTCPLLSAVRGLGIGSFDKQEVFGASPPSVFIGQWGYPKVLAGPLVPPFTDRDTSIMDNTENWVSRSFPQLISYRLSLFRGKVPIDVRSAAKPGKLLSIIQEGALPAKPVDTEVTFEKKPTLDVIFSPREAPVGPSAPVKRIILAGSSSVPRRVDSVVSDLYLSAQEGVGILHDAGITQRHITRLLTVGLLGLKERRRLVPSEWSITAVDDILGGHLLERVKEYNELGEFQVFGHEALANNVQVLLFPSSWMFEALEAWSTSPNPVPLSDYEFYRGRKSYARNLEGAYYAAKLPILEYLYKIKRQAGAIAFLEVSREWIPLGVWRFREIAREALRKPPEKVNALNEALEILSKRLKLDIQVWVGRSKLINFLRTQKKILHYM